MVKKAEFNRFITDFLVVFVSLFTIFFFFDLFLLKEFVAQTSAALLNSLGVTASVKGLTITSNGVNFIIINMCTGLVSFSIFAGLMNATRKIKLDKRIMYSLAALPILLSWNVLRVVTTLYFASPSTLYLMHDFFWIASASIILLIYFVVVNHELKKEQRHATKKRKKKPKRAH